MRLFIFWVAVLSIMVLVPVPVNAEHHEHHDGWHQGRPPLTVHFHNTTDRHMYLAFSYERGGDWRTEGWFTIEPNGTITMPTFHHRLYYFYAKTRHGNHAYQGQIPKRVTNEAFNYYDQNVPAGSYEVPFIQRYVDNQYTEMTENLGW